jgi:hypothetical protein
MPIVVALFLIGVFIIYSIVKGVNEMVNEVHENKAKERKQKLLDQHICVANYSVSEFNHEKIIKQIEVGIEGDILKYESIVIHGGENGEKSLNIGFSHSVNENSVYFSSRIDDYPPRLGTSISFLMSDGKTLLFRFVAPGSKFRVHQESYIFNHCPLFLHHFQSLSQHKIEKIRVSNFNFMEDKIIILNEINQRWNRVDELIMFSFKEFERLVLQHCGSASILEESINMQRIIDLDNNLSDRQISQEVKDRVWRRDGGRCVRCGSKYRLEFDHIVPFSKGGSNSYRNIQLLCENCNRSKSNRIG